MTRAGQIGTFSHAIFSPDRAYRYRLSREVVKFGGEGMVCFVLLNPSTADETQDDPTVRRCIGFARAWGFASLEVVNLFALRATDPEELLRHPNPVGPLNDYHIGLSTEQARSVIIAWGAHKAADCRAPAVLESFRATGIAPAMLGLTRSGYPRHPLYLPKNTPCAQLVVTK